MDIKKYLRSIRIYQLPKGNSTCKLHSNSPQTFIHYQTCPTRRSHILTYSHPPHAPRALPLAKANLLTSSYNTLV